MTTGQGVKESTIPQYVDGLLGKTTGIDGPNCFGAALGMLGSYVDTVEAQYYLERDWLRIGVDQLKPGDVIVYDEFEHMAVYMGDDGSGQKVFHKPNWSYRSAYRVDRFDEAWWESTKANFWFTTNKWDRFGEKEPTKESCQKVKMAFYTPRSDVSVVSTFDVAPSLVSSQLPVLQYYVLRAADVVGVDPYVRPYLSFAESIMHFLSDIKGRFFPPAAAASLEVLSPLGREFAEAFLRLHSFDTQISTLNQQWDPITETNASRKEPQMYRERSFSFDGAMRGEIALHLIAMGVPVDRLPEAMQRAEAAIRSRLESNLSLVDRGWNARTIPFPIIKEIETVAKTCVSPSVGVVAGSSVVEATPVDLMRDPFGLGGLLGGGGADHVRLVPLPHDVFMASAQELTLKREPVELKDLPRVQRIADVIGRTARVMELKSGRP